MSYGRSQCFADGSPVSPDGGGDLRGEMIATITAALETADEATLQAIQEMLDGGEPEAPAGGQQLAEKVGQAQGFARALTFSEVCSEAGKVRRFAERNKAAIRMTSTPTPDKFVAGYMEARKKNLALTARAYCGI